MKIAYIIPHTELSGGIVVILQHYQNLLEMGHEVSIFSEDTSTMISWKKNIPVIPLNKIDNKIEFDVAIATFWTTVDSVKKINSKRYLYFVQSDERNFYDDAKTIKLVQKTYQDKEIEFVTMAKWIQSWLFDEFKQKSYYIPNGVDLSIFNTVGRIANNKPRFLLEGKLYVPSKGLAEAYNIIKNVNCEKWMICADAKKPKSWKVDKFFWRLTQDKMADVYRKCDVLLKMSRVESFSLPPLEMMACGGTVIMRRVTGIEDYAINGFNCIIVDSYKEAVTAVDKLIKDKKMLENLQNNALETAKKWPIDNQKGYLRILLHKEPIDTSLYLKNYYRYSFENSVDNYSKYDLIQSIENHKEYIEEVKEINHSQSLELDKLNKIIIAVRESRLWKTRNKIAKTLGRGQL